MSSEDNSGLSSAEAEELAFVRKYISLPNDTAHDASMCPTLVRGPIKQVTMSYKLLVGQVFAGDIINNNVDLIDFSDLEVLRKATQNKYSPKVKKSLYSDESLLHFFNDQFRYHVEIAVGVEPHDYHKDQIAFLQAYSRLVHAIENIAHPVLKDSVELPSDYVRHIESSFLLGFGKPRKRGAPRKWKRDRLYFSLLTLFQAISGQPPSGSKGDSPSVRFMRTVLDILRSRLHIIDSNSKDFADLSILWRQPDRKDFLYEWFGENGGAEAIQTAVKDSLHRHLPVTASSAKQEEK